MDSLIALPIVPKAVPRTVPLAAALLLAGLGLGGCADAVTFSRSERATAATLASEGDHEAAAVIYANQVRRNPKDYRAHYHLGQAQEAQGLTQQALRSLRTALDVMPLTPAGRNDEQAELAIIDGLSSVLASEDADGSQLDAIDRAGKGDPSRKLLVAMTHAKAGRPDNALASFREAHTLNREDPRIAKQFGLYLESLRQEEEATTMLKRAYRLDPGDEQVAAALRRVGVIPGPAVLSATELTKPGIPLGPLPEWKRGEKGAEARTPPTTPADPAVPTQGAAGAVPPTPAAPTQDSTLN